MKITPAMTVKTLSHYTAERYVSACHSAHQTDHTRHT